MSGFFIHIHIVGAHSRPVMTAAISDTISGTDSPSTLAPRAAASRLHPDLLSSLTRFCVSSSEVQTSAAHIWPLWTCS